MTDALLRRVNVDRYDDREIVQTNLVECYECLMEFGRKHLLDQFFMENDQRKRLLSSQPPNSPDQRIRVQYRQLLSL